MFRVLVYVGNTIHNDETVECIEYAFHDVSKMHNYLVNTSKLMHEKEKYFNYVIDEIKIEEKVDLSEK
jgi:hypothetical protein